MKFSLKIKLTIAIFIISGFFCQSQENLIDKGYHVKIGVTVPDIHFKFTNGDSLWISELRGKVVVLQFTASWCSVCRKE
ncbi:MAG: redoxin domain-containing protein, partial [Bacteroidales bacterium]|nr:redoxin domain-containing protein [Bacteroidales bacterium]